MIAIHRRQRRRLNFREIPWEGVRTTFWGILATAVVLAFIIGMLIGVASSHRPAPYQVTETVATRSTEMMLPVQTQVAQVNITERHLGDSEVIVPALVDSHDEIRLIARNAGSGKGSVQVNPTARIHLYAITLGNVGSTLPSVQRGQAIIISETTHGKLVTGTKVTIYYRIE